MIADFLHLTPVANFELPISPRSFEKNRNDPEGLGGNWFMKKTRSRKTRDTVPLSDQALIVDGDNGLIAIVLVRLRNEYYWR